MEPAWGGLDDTEGGAVTVSVTVPPPDKLPFLDVALGPLLIGSFSVDDLLLVFGCMLTERKICVVGQDKLQVRGLWLVLCVYM
jgi:hypothetical protein